MADSDQQLDSETVSALYAQYADDLRAYLTGLLRNPELAADVLQSTFMKAIERGCSADSKTRKAWLFRVAYNEAMDRRRRVVSEDRTVRKMAWWIPSAAEAADVSLDQQESAARVRLAIGRLPQEQQDIIRRRIYEGQTFADISETLGVPLGTVLTRMRLATQKLMIALESERD